MLKPSLYYAWRRGVYIAVEQPLSSVACMPRGPCQLFVSIVTSKHPNHSLKPDMLVGSLGFPLRFSLIGIQSKDFWLPHPRGHNELQALHNETIPNNWYSFFYPEGKSHSQWGHMVHQRWSTRRPSSAKPRCCSIHVICITCPTNCNLRIWSTLPYIWSLRKALDVKQLLRSLERTLGFGRVALVWNIKHRFCIVKIQQFMWSSYQCMFSSMHGVLAFSNRSSSWYSKHHGVTE